MKKILLSWKLSGIRCMPCRAIWYGQLKQLVNVDVLIFEYGFYSTNFAIRSFFLQRGSFFPYRYHSQCSFGFIVIIAERIVSVLPRHMYVYSLCPNHWANHQL